jgi:hypothetical protein
MWDWNRFQRIFMPLTKNPKIKNHPISLSAVVCRGHQGASGTGPRFGNTCEGGSIHAQDQVFIKKGFDFRNYLKAEPFWGTLNCYIGNDLDIDPLHYLHQRIANPGTHLKERQVDLQSVNWTIQLHAVKWHPNFPAENFSLLEGYIQNSGQNSGQNSEGRSYPCYVYYPDPSTKPNNPIPNTILEIIAPPLQFSNGSAYGQSVLLSFSYDAFRLL